MAAANAELKIAAGGGRTVNAARFLIELATELNGDNIDLPGLPDVVVRIQRALADERTSTKGIVMLVASEPALAARLVHIANSGAFNKSSHEIGDLSAAISSLGFNVVRSQAAAFAMRQMERQEWLMPVRPALADICKTSNGVAALCFAVAKRVPGVRPDEALSTGLFHLIGKLYLCARARQESLNPGEIANWEQAMNDWHATIARSILEHWKISAPVAEAIENQNAIFETDSRDLSPLTRILCAAKLHYRLRKPRALREPDAEAALAKIRLNGHSFEELVRTARADAEAMRAAMG